MSLPETEPVRAAIDVAAAFREHGPFVWRALRSLGVSDKDVDDQCQEVFVVVHRRRGDFEGRSSLRTWLYSICIRKAAAYRRRPLREIGDGAVPDSPSSSPGPFERAARLEARAHLDEVVAMLDDDKRAVFVLYEIEELTMAEVADAIGCPLQTAFSRLHAARKIVESKFRQWARDGEGRTS
jgi:RNA polymerase sigma-70 factor (ECF subfamily)